MKLRHFVFATFLLTTVTICFAQSPCDGYTSYMWTRMSKRTSYTSCFDPTNSSGVYVDSVQVTAEYMESKISRA